MQKTQVQTAGQPRVTGAGVLESGASFYLVSSQSEEGRCHVVEQRPTRLSCDCKSFHYRGRCAHVAAVVSHKQRLQLAEAEREYQLARVQLTETRQELQAINTANTGASASRGTQDKPDKVDRQGTRPAYFGGRSQQAFSVLK